MLTTLLGALAAGTAMFQVGSTSANGLQAIEATVPEGRLTVYLPSNLMAGDRISGTVVAEPAGSTAEDRRKNLAVLEGMVVAAPGGDVSPKTPQFGLTLPSTLSGRQAPIMFKNPQGATIGRFNVPLNQTPIAPMDFHFQPNCQAGRPTRVTGPFDGDLGNSNVAIGGKPAFVLAESPRQTIAVCPSELSGPTPISTSEGEAGADGTIRVLKLSLTSPKTQLTQGEQTSLRVEVSGLEGLQQNVQVKVKNLTPTTVRLQGGDEQTLTVAPSQVDSRGICGFSLNVVSRSTGGFSISAIVAEAFQAAPALNVKPPDGFKVHPKHLDGVSGDTSELDDKTKVGPQGFKPEANDDKQFKRDPNSTSRWQHWDLPEKKTLDDVVVWIQKLYTISFVKNEKTYRGGQFRVHFKYTGKDCIGGKWRQIFRSTRWVGDDENNLKKAALVDGRYVPADPPSKGDNGWDIDTNDAGRTANNPDYPNQDKGEMIDKPQRAREAAAYYTTNTPPRKKAKVVVEEVEFFSFFIKDGKICKMLKWGMKVKWVFQDGDDPTDPASMDRAAVSTEFSGPTQCKPGTDDWTAGEANLKQAMGRFPTKPTQ